MLKKGRGCSSDAPSVDCQTLGTLRAPHLLPESRTHHSVGGASERGFGGPQTQVLTSCTEPRFLHVEYGDYYVKSALPQRVAVKIYRDKAGGPLSREPHMAKAQQMCALITREYIGAPRKTNTPRGCSCTHPHLPEDPQA